MKNLLLATTALVAFAGAATAEVTISGSGRMGIVYDEGIVNDNFVVEDGELVRVNDSGIRFSSRVRVLFTLTQETDAGVTFGASIRADNANAGNNGQAGSVFMSGAFGKLSMGDVDGAAESAVGNLSGVGYTGLNDLNEAFYLQQGNSDLDSNQEVSAFALPAALYEYTTGPASFYISLGNPGGVGLSGAFFSTDTDVVSELVIDSAFGLGAKYSVDNYSIGVGYESLDINGLNTNAGLDGIINSDLTPSVDDVVTELSSNVDNWILGGSATFGGFTLKAQYGEGSGDFLDLTQYGVSGDYTFDAFTVTAFWRSVELKNRANESVERQPFGLGVTYDLGGGASVAAGVVDPDIEGEDYRADLGVNFSF
jgi:outer membrane protein OmpU